MDYTVGATSSGPSFLGELGEVAAHWLQGFSLWFCDYKYTDENTVR